jgi:phage FluMu protein Com
MKRICAWCKKYLGENEGSSDMITHGICPKCQAMMKAENAKQKSKRADLQK